MFHERVCSNGEVKALTEILLDDHKSMATHKKHESAMKTRPMEGTAFLITKYVSNLTTPLQVLSTEVFFILIGPYFAFYRSHHSESSPSIYRCPLHLLLCHIHGSCLLSFSLPPALWLHPEHFYLYIHCPPPPAHVQTSSIWPI